MNIPKTSRAVLLPEYNSNLIRAMLSLKLGEVTLPEISENDVLIKVLASPINPSDIAFLQGGYNIVKPLPAIPGFEAVGTVLATGKNYEYLLGKRVSCFSQDASSGCWSSYLVTSAQNCLIANDGLSLHEAATLIINPLTAIGLVEMALKNNSKTIVINAAGGVVASFIRVLAEKNGWKTINIFRKEPIEFNNSGYQNHYKLCSTDADFSEELFRLLSNETNVTVFDAVGGALSGQMFNILPSGSSIVVYGGLSNEDICGVNVLQMIFHDKKILGFNLNEFIGKNGTEHQREKLELMANELVMNHQYKTPIQAEFSLEEVVKGLRTYVKNMSAGKVLLIP